jgi:hypothetical protein
MEIEKGSYFIVIPVDVYEIEGLSPRAMVVFGLILSLTGNKDGYCVASNGYMAEILKVSERTISGCIAELKQHKLIAVEVGQSKQTRTLYRRITTFWTAKKAYKTREQEKKRPRSVEPEWFEDYLKRFDDEDEARA